MPQQQPCGWSEQPGAGGYPQGSGMGGGGGITVGGGGIIPVGGGWLNMGGGITKDTMSQVKSLSFFMCLDIRRFYVILCGIGCCG